MRPITPAILALTLALAGTLAACGGSHETETASTDREPPTTTLLDDDGNAMPVVAAAVPADAGARTRQGRYATAQQAAWLERSLGAAVLQVEVGCCGGDGVEQAVDIAHRRQTVRDLTDSAPVLVRGADLRLAAVAADRMAAAGHANVWLVTQ